MLLNECIQQFHHYLQITDKSSETIRSYMSNLDAFEKYVEGKYNCPLYTDEITANDIEEYLYSLKIKKLQNSSRSRNLYTLKSFFNFAIKNKICTCSPTIQIEPIKIQRKERTYLSIEEVTKLINAIEHPLISIVIQTLFYSGLRINECLSLKLEDVDFKSDMIHVIGGKGNKNRNIPINKNLRDILWDYLNYTRPSVESNYFFALKKSGKVTPQYVNYILNETVKKLGWEKHVSAHILRHSFASNLIKNGVNIVYVQKLLGHSNLKVTSIYTHANMDELAKSVNML